MGRLRALTAERRVPSDSIGLCKRGEDCGEEGAFAVKSNGLLSISTENGTQRTTSSVGDITQVLTADPQCCGTVLRTGDCMGHLITSPGPGPASECVGV